MKLRQLFEVNRCYVTLPRLSHAAENKSARSGNDGVVYDATTHRLYTSNGVDANLVIYEQLDPNTYKLVEATTTRPYARTMALDPKNKKVYLVTAEGTADPAKKINKGVASFYPNRYFPDTFTVLTYAPH